jgi:hypothetical protein
LISGDYRITRTDQPPKFQARSKSFSGANRHEATLQRRSSFHSLN